MIKINFHFNFIYKTNEADEIYKRCIKSIHRQEPYYSIPKDLFEDISGKEFLFLEKESDQSQSFLLCRDKLSQYTFNIRITKHKFQQIVIILRLALNTSILS